MNNNIRTIYLYIVSLVTLGMIVGGIVSLVNNVSLYFFPDDIAFYQEESNQNYNYYDDYYNSYETDYTEAQENEIEKENYRTKQIKNATVSFAVIIIGVIMYKYHWNLIEKEKNK